MLKKQSGFVLLLAVLIVMIILIFTATQLDKTRSFIRFGSNKILVEQSQALAEAGVEYALWQINENAGNWYGGGSEIAVGNQGTFFVTVVDDSPNLKTVQATGYIPNSTNPRGKASAKVQVGISSETIAFNYAVQVGTGGIFMENSSTIIGTAYSNKTGSKSIEGKNSSRIEGDAFAVGEVTDPDPTVTGSENENQPPSVMPTFDYQTWKDQAEAGGVTDCGGTCTFSSGNPQLGPRKYIGNLLFQNTAAATMNGPIWVTGNVTMKNSSSIKLNNSFGSTGTVLILDGKISTENSAQFIPTNSNPKGYILVVTTSTANDAVVVKNSGVNAIFYALEGGAALENSAQVTALVANKIEMKNSATLTYDQGLADAQFTNGPGGSWQIQRGSFKYGK